MPINKIHYPYNKEDKTFLPYTTLSATRNSYDAQENNYKLDGGIAMDQIWKANVTTQKGNPYTIGGSIYYNQNLFPDNHMPNVSFSSSEKYTAPLTSMQEDYPALKMDSDSSLSYVTNAKSSNNTPLVASFSSDSSAQDVLPKSNTPLNLSAVLKVDTQWSSGFNASIAVTNYSDSNIYDWILTFDEIGFSINSLWNATLTREDGSNSLVVEAPKWNKIIKAGETITVGFSASGNLTDAVNFTVETDGQKSIPTNVVPKDTLPTSPSVVKPSQPVNLSTPSTGKTGSQIPDTTTPVDHTNSPVVAAYYAEWAIYARNYKVSDIPADKLTHLIYAFTQITNNKIAIFDRWAAVDKRFTAEESVDGKGDSWNADSKTNIYGNFKELAELKAMNPDLTVVASVGGWTLSEPFSALAASETSRKIFADSVVEFLSTYTMFDGIDIDWEYPGSGGLSAGGPQDGVNYALLLKEVRDALDVLETNTNRTYELSIAAPAGQRNIAEFNAKDLSPFVNYFHVMAYDYHGAWDTTVTGHQAPVFAPKDSQDDIENTIELYLENGVDANQLVLGNPMYGRAWSGVKSGNDGGLYSAPTGAAPGNFGEAGVYDYKALLSFLEDDNSDWLYYWDDNAQAAYLHSKSSGIFSTFETPASIALKSEWARSKGLAGSMFWELSGDSPVEEKSLLAAAYDTWFGNKVTITDIANRSNIDPDVVLGGNGIIDSIIEDDVTTAFTLDNSYENIDLV